MCLRKIMKKYGIIFYAAKKYVGIIDITTIPKPPVTDEAQGEH